MGDQLIPPLPARTFFPLFLKNLVPFSNATQFASKFGQVPAQ